MEPENDDDRKARYKKKRKNKRKVGATSIESEPARNPSLSGATCNGFERWPPAQNQARSQSIDGEDDDICLPGGDNPSNPKFCFTEVHGDLFDCSKEDSMVVCTSEDLHMSKGINVVFQVLFEGIDELLEQGKSVGDVAVLKRGNRFVYYLITKHRFFQKPTYESLRSSLEAMKAHCKKHNVSSLAMPQIGCGLDRLDWRDVSEIIDEVFHDTTIKITVYSLPYNPTPLKYNRKMSDE